jgi:hypothetical protein
MVGALRWEEVNAVTFKLTDGESINTPACHGHWPGYRTTKAIAWAIQVAPGAWQARYADRGCKVSGLQKAKANAEGLVQGAIKGFVIEDPTGRLNRLAAGFIDRPTPTSTPASAVPTSSVPTGSAPAPIAPTPAEISPNS